MLTYNIPIDEHQRETIEKALRLLVLRRMTLSMRQGLPQIETLQTMIGELPVTEAEQPGTPIASASNVARHLQAWSPEKRGKSRDEIRDHNDHE